MRLLDALARSVGMAEHAAMGDTAAVSRSVRSDKPVLQFTPFPITLDPDIYRNPRSDSNPNGDLRTLFAFRQLVDPVPSFSEYYNPRGNSTEAVYGQIVEGASVGVDDRFTTGVIADARRKFSENYFADMDGTPGKWRPVYAVPENWYDTSIPGRFRDLDIDLDDQGGNDGPFTMIGHPGELQLSVGGDLASKASLDPETKIRSVRMKYLLVQFRRPWLNFLLFESGGWYLSRQPEGFCSSGKTDENAGVLPLLPTGMLLARDISIDVEWSEREQAFLDAAASSRKPAFLGPLPLHSQGSSTSLQVVGWISSLVPYSPKASDLRPGSFLVRNNGAFVARFSAAWQQGGRPATKESGSFPVLAAKSIDIPADVRNVSIKIEIMTFPEPVETWKTVATHQFDTPVKKCYELSGVTWKPALTEIPCAE